MTKIGLSELELTEEWAASDEALRLRADFPLFRGHGTTDSALVYFELDEDSHVGTHTDSAEEIVLVLDGTAEAVMAERSVALGRHELIVIPRGVAHDVRNVGTGVVRAVGFFAQGEVESTFEEPLEPSGERVFRVPPSA
jgi:mannose-6-phosphate isomerase-like protein (cupin superfamily)